MASRALVRDPVRIERFVENLCLGMEPRAAAAAAGFGRPQSTAKDLLAREDVMALVEAHREEMRLRYHYDRDRAVHLLLDAAEIARLQSDPKAIVGAVHELNMMHGYHAPLRVQTTVEASDRSRRRLAELTDDELRELDAIDGEFEEVG